MKQKKQLTDLQRMKAPESLRTRTLWAARQARQNPVSKRTPRFRGMKRVLAAACAFGILLGGAAIRTQISDGAGGAAAGHTFGLVAYAADTGETMEPKNSTIVFADGAGVDDLEKGFFSGCLFRVTGENIATVSASIDKGALYRTKTLTDFDTDAYYQMASAADAALRADKSSVATAAAAISDPRLEGADVVMPYGRGETEDETEMQWCADVCWKLENGFEEAYDPDVSYGFWAAPEQVNETIDLRDAWHSRIDTFEGAKLTVTVTFTDGVQQTQTMTLHTGKLGVAYPDSQGGLQLTGDVLTDEQAKTEAYVYGVYAEMNE
ncbi:MAG: hypothetical protein Q3Y08_01645 [Butyricicoccus sp.]|nr:hypothetical protein [Butyricicoccus sp.]